jgi:hypothetical protein
MLTASLDVSTEIQNIDFNHQSNPLTYNPIYTNAFKFWLLFVLPFFLLNQDSMKMIKEFVETAFTFLMA